MTVAFDNGTIIIAGACPVATAETLLGLLLQYPDAVVDMSEATTVHTALWQVLMAHGPKIIPPAAENVATQSILSRSRDRGHSPPTGEEHSG